MTIEQMIELFENFVWDPTEPNCNYHVRKDINAMIILNGLCPGKGKIIDYAGRDEISFDTDVAKLSGVITVDIILELCRCGVYYADNNLYMYV